MYENDIFFILDSDFPYQYSKKQKSSTYIFNNVIKSAVEIVYGLINRV